MLIYNPLKVKFQTSASLGKPRLKSKFIFPFQALNMNPVHSMEKHGLSFISMPPLYLCQMALSPGWEKGRVGACFSIAVSLLRGGCGRGGALRLLPYCRRYAALPRLRMRLSPMPHAPWSMPHANKFFIFHFSFFIFKPLPSPYQVPTKSLWVRANKKRLRLR